MAVRATERSVPANKARTAAPRQGYDVYPVHMLDDTKHTRNMIMGWTFRFDGPLDVEKLRTSLALLLDTGDWRKLAGRLKFTKTGWLEIHVPETFTDDEPPFAFTHNDLSAVTIDDDALGRKFPRSTKTACVYQKRQEFMQYVMAPNAPMTVQEYVRRGTPQLGLRITSFKDATLLGLTWPHTLMDGVGQKELLSAWSLALAGREREIPTMLGAAQDVPWNIAGRYADDEIDRYAVEHRLLKGLDHCKFLSKHIWLSVTSPAPEVRIFYLPTEKVNEWRQDATSLLDEDPGTDKPPFLSDGDIIAAWLVKVAASAELKPPQFVMAGAVNARYRVPELRHAKGVYVQNLLGLYYAQFPKDVVAGPLAHIALMHRRQVAEQSTEHQLIRCFKMRRHEVEHMNGRQKMKLYCHQGDQLMIVNNLSKIGIADGADFSPAVLPNDDGTYSSGSAVYYHFTTYPSIRLPRNSFVLFHKNNSGYWISGNVAQGTWSAIMQEIGVEEVL